MIDLPHDAVQERIGQTLEAISGDAPAIFELYDMIRIRALVLAVALILSLAGCLAAPPQNAVDAAVTRVIDGDTFEARLPSGEAVTVRLLGVDTPETVHPRRPPEPGGAQAAAFTKQQLTGRRVTLVADPWADDTDSYGRWLRYVVLDDGTNLNAGLVRRGLATAYRQFPHSERSAFIRLEAEAQAAGRGLWALPR